MGQIVTLEQHNLDIANKGSLIKIADGYNEYMYRLPKEPSDERKIINYDLPKEEQYWRRQGIPKNYHEWTASRQEDFNNEEWNRCFNDGAWVLIKGELHWIPPNYYFHLNWWKIKNPANDNYPDFRFKRLANVYAKQIVRETPNLIGSYVLKNRRDGETIMAVSDVAWEAIITEDGFFGMQSMTGEVVKRVCWRNFMYGYKRLPPIFKPLQSGTDNPAQELNLRKPASRVTVADQKKMKKAGAWEIVSEQSVLVMWTSTNSTAFDGMEMTRCLIDEFNKWTEASATNAVNTYKEALLLGDERRGIFDIFSSPSETNGVHNDEAKIFWDNAAPVYDEYGNLSTKSGFLRWFSNPLHGIHGHYDKYGIADQDRIFKTLMDKRNSVSASKKLSEIRKHPLNIDEAYGSFENSNIWSNIEGLKARKIYLMGTKFKTA